MVSSKTSLKKISFYAGLLQTVIVYAMIGLVVALLVKWVQDKIPVLQDLTFWWQGALYREPISNLQVDSLHYLREMTFSQRAIGFMADAGLTSVVLIGLFYGLQLMGHFKRGEIFSLRTIELLRKTSTFALIWALCAPFMTLLVSVIAFHENIERRGLSLAYASDDSFIKLVFFVFLLVTTVILQEGYHLKSEADLTV